MEAGGSVVGGGGGESGGGGSGAAAPEPEEERWPYLLGAILVLEDQVLAILYNVVQPIGDHELPQHEDGVVPHGAVVGCGACPPAAVHVQPSIREGLRLFIACPSAET